MNWSILVDAEDLAARIGEKDLRLVDARFALGDADAGENAWRQAHLPGAGYAHLDRDLSDRSKPASEGRHPLPEAAAFCATLARLGITPEVQVVVYDGSDGAMAAARFWWLMKLLGHRRVAVLDGGFTRWTALGLPVETTPPVISPGRYEASFDESKIVRTEEVQRRMSESPGWLLDARAAERFRGEVEPIDRVAGHIPGALNRPFSANLDAGRFRAPEVLRGEFSALLGAHAPNEAVLNCGSGVTACHNLLAMEHAGLHGARIYAGSWSGWISDPDNPIATGP